MTIKKLFPVVIAGLFVILAIFSCKLDPWSTGKKSTDVVLITKTTNLDLAQKYGNVKKGQPHLRSKVGSVKMSHKTHQDAGLKCVDCHHKNENPEREKKCAACHFGDDGYEIMHGLCVDCHVGKKKGPQKCKECH